MERATPVALKLFARQSWERATGVPRSHEI
jgi:hypothetical protein